jgi:hypothetical protein
MHATNRSFTEAAAAGIAVAGIAALAAAPLAPVPQALSAPAVTHEIRLAAAVPPGGLITSFLGNQLLYCSLICPSLVQGVVTVPITVLQTPFTFVTALQSGNLLKAIGATAASVTGPVDAAFTTAIVNDGTLVAPRAQNTLEVAVVGLLNIAPSAAGGLPGIVTAIETARQDTFDALNAKVVANPPPLAMPHGVVQVATVEGINVIGSIIFPALNDVLFGIVQVPDAVAQTLAQTGDPVRAVGAGVSTATALLNDAGGTIAAAVATAVTNIRAAVDQAHPHSVGTLTLAQKQPAAVGTAVTNIRAAVQQAHPHSVGTLTLAQKQPAAITSAGVNVGAPQRVVTVHRHVSAKPNGSLSHPLRDAIGKIRHAVRDAVKKVERPHHAKSNGA